MNVLRCLLEGLLIIEPKVFGDARGFFLETWNRDRYREAGLDADFVQDNVSFSRRGILRGLHFQNPKPQGKLLQVLQGEVFDVAVDIRRSSPTFGKWHGLIALGREQAAVLHSAGVRARLCRAQRDRAVPLQVHRVLLAEGRTGHPLGRPGHRHRVAAEGAAALRRRGSRKGLRLRMTGAAMERDSFALNGDSDAL